jgi:hypothetical protein
MCDHDNPSVIPTLAISPFRCVTNFALSHTCSWERCDPTGVW